MRSGASVAGLTYENRGARCALMRPEVRFLLPPAPPSNSLVLNEFFVCRGPLQATRPNRHRSVIHPKRDRRARPRVAAAPAREKFVARMQSGAATSDVARRVSSSGSRSWPDATREIASAIQARRGRPSVRRRTGRRPSPRGCRGMRSRLGGQCQREAPRRLRGSALSASVRQRTDPFMARAYPVRTRGFDAQHLDRALATSRRSS